MSEEELWMELASTAAAPECVAVGECGLNYTKDFSEPSVQREVFKRQVSCLLYFYFRSDLIITGFLINYLIKLH